MQRLLDLHIDIFDSVAGSDVLHRLLAGKIEGREFRHSATGETLVTTLVVIDADK